MPYNPDAMTIIVSGDLPPEMKDKLTNQLTADVLTAKEFAEREQALSMQEQVEDETKENREAAGLTNTDDGFSAPEESEVDNVEVTDTSEDEADSGTETDTESDSTAEPTDTATEIESSGEEGEDASADEEEATVDDADLEEVSEKDAAVKDDLDEPNAAFEHASSLGTKELGRYLRLGVQKYKRRVRRERTALVLAQETLQMEAAQRQKLIRRLLYVKPSDSGFTSKLQTFISTINNPDDWVALIDSDDVRTSDHELTKRQITEALGRAGIQMFENVETLADTYNQVQKAITEPSNGNSNDDQF